MKSQFTLLGILSVSLLYPLSANAGHGGGGGGAHPAPAAHASMPAAHAAPAPHFQAPPQAPHMQAPRAMQQAPHFQAPHAMQQVPHFQAPHAMQQSPHFEAPHAIQQSPHFEASHGMQQSPHFEASHAMQQSPHFEASHPMQQSPHFETSHAINGAGRGETHAINPHEAGRSAFAEPHGQEGFNRASEPAQRGESRQLINAHGVGERGLQNEGLRAGSLEHGERSEFGARKEAGSFAGREPAHSLANAENISGRNRALGVAGGLAAGGLATAALSRGGHGEENVSHSFARIPGAPSYANPRHSLAPEIGRALSLSPHAAPNLTYRGEARDIPRIGDARSGRPGPMDPGGYIRNSREASPNINPAFARQQLSYANRNYMQAAAFNARNIVGNRGAWPWRLPNYSAPWFGGWQGNWNWDQNWYGNNGGWGPNWGAYNNGGGFFGFLSTLSPWGCNSDLGWIPSLNYYNNYGWNGQNYPCDYYAANGFCPTPYVFNVNNGQFWNVGSGYADYLPENYQAPITVAVQESVPVYSADGQILSYQLQNFYYNAYWDPQAQNYGYYDYKQQFHWLTFPWQNAWNGNM